MNYQWYPGHMTKTVRQMKEVIKLIDLVIELVDARIPMSSRNPDIDSLAQGKSRIILLNKCDLADERVTKEWKDFFEKKGISVLEADSRNRSSLNKLNDIIKIACKERIERNKRRGIINKPVRAMVAGIPNVGKSTFINSYAGRACAKTGNKPGVTKGKQWIKLNKDLELLDTPGILWPKFESEIVGERLALIGAINDDILDSEELSYALIDFLKKNYQGLLSERYGVDENEYNKAYEVLEACAVARKCVTKGNVADTSKMAGMLLDDFRSGKLGRISLENSKEQF